MLKLLGPTVRRHRSHPQHQVTFATRTLIPRTIETRRAGRHRLSWTHETVKTAWSINPHNPSFDVENREMRLALQNMAQNDNILLTDFFDLLLAAAAPTGFTEAYGMEEKDLVLSCLIGFVPDRCCPEDHVLFSMGQLTKTP